MPNLQVYRRDAKGITYATPTSPYTVRFKTNHSTKSLQGVRVDHFKTEVIANEPVNHDVSNVTITDPVSIRISVSGSNLSQARITEILTALSSQLVTWSNESAYLGFEPKTLPIIPEV